MSLDEELEIKAKSFRKATEQKYKQASKQNEFSGTKAAFAALFLASFTAFSYSAFFQSPLNKTEKSIQTVIEAERDTSENELEQKIEYSPTHEFYAPVMIGKESVIKKHYEKYHIGSDYGIRINPFDRSKKEFHPAIDIVVPKGTPVRACTDGTVKKIHEPTGSLVYQINGYKVGYAHLVGIEKQKGDEVKKGEILGYVGRVGPISGKLHLHFEISKYKNGTWYHINPLNIKYVFQEKANQEGTTYHLANNSDRQKNDQTPSKKNPRRMINHQAIFLNFSNLQNQRRRMALFQDEPITLFRRFF